MSIEKLLVGMNIPGAVAHINGSVNVFNFTDALKEIRGLMPDASHEQLAHEVLEIQQDEAFGRVDLGDKKFLFVPRDLMDVMSVYNDSMRDQLTNVYNRRGLQIMYSRLRSSVSSEGVLVMLFLDANRFKVLNDKFGHQIGDRVLRAMCNRLRGQLKREDIVTRLDGDEFVALIWLPNDELKQYFTQVRLPAIQEVVCQEVYAMKDGKKILPVGFALGVAEHVGALPESLDDLLRKAELGMYADKGAAAR